MPALVVASVVSIALTAAGQIRWGLAGAAAACFMGNLDGLFLWIDASPWRGALSWLLRMSPASRPEHSYRFFRCAHEVIPNTVHELSLIHI